MNDICYSPLLETDLHDFPDSKQEQWVLLCGRLLDETTVQVVLNNEIRQISLIGNVCNTKGYDILCLGHINDDQNYVYVHSMWEPEFLSPFFYDFSVPIHFIYLDIEKTMIVPGRKHVLAVELKKKNGSTKEIVNISVKKYNKDLQPIFLLSDIVQTNIGITKTLANGIQLGSDF